MRKEGEGSSTDEALVARIIKQRRIAEARRRVGRAFMQRHWPIRVEFWKAVVKWIKEQSK